MKKNTLHGDEQLLEQARPLPTPKHSTLNAIFREWLQRFTAQSGGVQEFDAVMKRLKHVQAGRRFSRDEMNEGWGNGPVTAPHNRHKQKGRAPGPSLKKLKLVAGVGFEPTTSGL